MLENRRLETLRRQVRPDILEIIIEGIKKKVEIKYENWTADEARFALALIDAKIAEITRALELQDKKDTECF